MSHEHGDEPVRAWTLGEDRLANPTDDLTSALMHAEVDGERLTTPEFGSFFILLVVAGNETTRNAISHGMKAAHRPPRPARALVGRLRRRRPDRGRGDRPLGHARSSTSAARPPATPRSAACRSPRATRSCSGTARPTATSEVFDDPYRFDVRRDPNPAGRLRRRRAALLPRRQPGPARDHRDVRRAAAAACPTCRSPASPTDLQSDFIHGIKRMPCAWGRS